jgi:hypothetical protein
MQHTIGGDRVLVAAINKRVAAGICTIGDDANYTLKPNGDDDVNRAAIAARPPAAGRKDDYQKQQRCERAVTKRHKISFCSRLGRNLVNEIRRGRWSIVAYTTTRTKCGCQGRDMAPRDYGSGAKRARSMPAEIMPAIRRRGPVRQLTVPSRLHIAPR